jgi:hypothetical protein
MVQELGKQLINIVDPTMQIINVSPPLLLLTSIAAAMSQRAAGYATERREEEKEVPFSKLDK